MVCENVPLYCMLKEDQGVWIPSCTLLLRSQLLLALRSGVCCFKDETQMCFSKIFMC